MDLVEQRLPHYSTIALATFVFLMASGIFGSIIYFGIESDIQAHNERIARINAGESEWPANFLYYYTVSLLSRFSTSLWAINVVSIALLSLALTVKFMLTVRFARDFSGGQLTNALLFFSVGMLLFFPLPNLTLMTNHNYYLGQITPNVWHNSTTIFLLPFALLLFWKQFCVLRDDNRKHIWQLVVLVVLNIAIKPSFFMAFLPATALMLIMRFGFNKAFWIHSTPLLAGLLFLGAQYYLIYELQMGSIQSERSAVILQPFATWRTWVPIYLIPTAVVTSFLFPFTYLATRLVPGHRDLMKYAIFLMVSSMLIFVLIRETGPRSFHGNFGWQNVVSMYILTLVIGTDVCEKREKGKRTWKLRMLECVFLASVLSGFVYLARVLSVGYL